MPSIEEVKHYLAGEGIEVWQFDQPTPNSEEAARAVGCSPAEIAKSILFIVGGKPLMVVTSGDMKVKSSKLKQAAGLSGKVKLPLADEVLRHTGYRPGGVCPFLLPGDLPVFLDASLRRFARIYPAAGDDHSAVPISVDCLMDLTLAQEVDVCEPLAV
ncbi:prolyl-tRNA synthetase [Desulfuromonas versatilis]|uniref:Prolyl-tRNA synthetase n=1 Tax=Desulfuromonas versatilis TaxID=2802975 RepID=A0ABM8HNJ6_9BACT|nr:YbaK/EbsC family protein [Desulfuromonas versatilis]BCR04421.1 prolyl-tRNA synthetase [Desulfuromonas versatilis]